MFALPSSSPLNLPSPTGSTSGQDPFYLPVVVFSSVHSLVRGFHRGISTCIRRALIRLTPLLLSFSPLLPRSPVTQQLYTLCGVGVALLHFFFTELW
jgi:hypothetical protein